MILLYYYISIIIVIIAIIIILLGLNWIIGKWFGCVWKLNNGAGYCIDSGKEQTSICWNVENLVMSVWLRFFFYWKVAFLDFSFHSIPFHSIWVCCDYWRREWRWPTAGTFPRWNTTTTTTNKWKKRKETKTISKNEKWGKEKKKKDSSR